MAAIPTRQPSAISAQPIPLGWIEATLSSFVTNLPSAAPIAVSITHLENASLASIIRSITLKLAPETTTILMIPIMIFRMSSPLEFSISIIAAMISDPKNTTPDSHAVKYRTSHAAEPSPPMWAVLLSIQNVPTLIMIFSKESRSARAHVMTTFSATLFAASVAWHCTW